jgi:hypothetical protein
MPTTLDSFEFKQFVQSNFRSLSTLEVFLVLIEDHFKRWTPSQISQRLRSNDAYAKDQLWELVGNGLVKPIEGEGGEISFCSACENREELCSGLREAFQIKRTALISLIYSKESEPIKDLADAFVFNKKKDKL